MNIEARDVAGNDGLGRYIFLPGSDGRAREIADHFDGLEIREHPRQHNFYKGSLAADGYSIDVAAVATGMGTPSVDIIVNELYRLGARRFLRVGTAGSLQPAYLSIGAVVIATAAVRDETTSSCYLPREVPALASLNMAQAARRACSAEGIEEYYSGVVHSKASLYARELGAGPLQRENRRFMEQLAACGVLASEMECSILFALAAVFSQEQRSAGTGQVAPSPEKLPSAAAGPGVEAGAILSIIGDETAFGSGAEIKAAEKRAIAVGLHTIIEREKMRRDAEELR
jgi:uridine phosphorylase